MLRLDDIDLDDLGSALEFRDGLEEMSWWFDPASGETIWSGGAVEDAGSEEDLLGRGAIQVEPISSQEGYRLMESFIGSVDNGRARELLWRAIDGKGAFRRFKDTLYEFPGLMERWLAFHDDCVRRYAIEWLVDAGVVDPDEADDALDG
ncbi:UPF0158 family protein [Arthrobacter mobilis]|uniref:Uncharacterized protein n=1 Tax=Arthrobacter mobilis TaxID=2724944 RepID=A0A7X6HAP2_9MICC|nr:UPF0158 family protein [Arthrobacter mobilis]NKX53130.1 hypothetical protein [Arthrobacter mobilis]